MDSYWLTIVSGSEQGNADIYDIVDYFASHDPEVGLGNLLTDVKAVMDSQTETL